MVKQYGNMLVCRAGLCLQRMGFICMNSGVKVRAALTTAITRKAIGLGYISADNASRVVSFMANDINKIYDGMQARSFP